MATPPESTSASPTARPAATPAEGAPIRSVKRTVDAIEVGKRAGPLFGGLFVLYLIISGNFVGEVFSCDLQRLMKENFVVKHLLGIMTLFFFVNMVAGNIPWSKALLAAATVVMYLLFVLSNRSSTYTQLTTIGLLFVIFLLQMVRDDEEKEDAPNSELIQDLIRAQWAIGILIMVVILVGHLLYVGRKKIEFGPKFSYLALFEGTACRNVDERVSTLESLRALLSGNYPAAKAATV